MKTAVSIPDSIFQKAERLAKRKRVTRSQLYARALEDLLRREDEDEIVARLNQVYGDGSSKLDPVLRALPARILEPEDW